MTGAVAVAPPSLPVLNCFFLIFSAKLDATDHDCCVSESLEPEHWADPSFQSPMILLDQVVQVLAESGPSLFVEALHLPASPARLDVRPRSHPT
jgi:hypothetical protein